MSEAQFNRMQLLKRQLFAMRNGVVADTLRQAGCPARIIFGLNLPQINDIARSLEADDELAGRLWAEKHVRESRLLAPMLMEPGHLDYSSARDMANDISWPEEADILCNKLLRKLAFAPELADELCTSSERLKRYTGLRLWMAITSVNLDEELRKKAVEAARAELGRPEPLVAMASQIIADNDF